MRHNFGRETACKTEKELEGQYNDISQGHRLWEREVDGHESGQYPLNGASNIIILPLYQLTCVSSTKH